MTQGTRNRTAGIALGATALVHIGLAWWLMGLRQTTPVHEAHALTVTWIERPAPVMPLLPAPTLERPRIPSNTAPPPPPRAPSRALQAVAVDASSIDSDAPLPTAAALLEQAGDWARQQAPVADFFAHDPLQRRAPPAADGRFAMRHPVSVEDVVVAVGKLFGGGPSDPCPRIRRNIATLGTGGDAELTREEIRRLQQFCL